MTGNELFVELARRVLADELWIIALLVAADGWNACRLQMVEMILIAHPKCRAVQN